MRELGIGGVSGRKNGKVRKERAEMPFAPDLVRRDSSAACPDQLWVADIACIPTWEGWLYLAATVDVLTKRCCGWSTRDDHSCDLVIEPLGMAVTLRKPGNGTVHRSDRGSRHGSLSFGKTLREAGIMPSTGSKGDPQATPPRRASWPPSRPSSSAATASRPGTGRTLLDAVFAHGYYASAAAAARPGARLAVFRYLEGFCNPRRRHSALGYKSPAEMRKCSWKRRRRRNWPLPQVEVSMGTG